MGLGRSKFWMERVIIIPYIKEDRRGHMDAIRGVMVHKQVKADGDLNYLLYSYCKMSVKPSYSNFKNYIGELRQCATEIERRLLAPYEDSAMERNGDI